MYFGSGTALFKVNKSIVTSIQGNPLSQWSNPRRTEILAAENKISLFELLQRSPCYAIALDESCDIVDAEQMSIFVRFLDVENKVFRQEFLYFCVCVCVLEPLRYREVLHMEGRSFPCIRIYY